MVHVETLKMSPMMQHGRLKLSSRLLRLLTRLSSKLRKPTPKQAQWPITTVEHVTGNQATKLYPGFGYTSHWWSTLGWCELF